MSDTYKSLVEEMIGHSDKCWYDHDDYCQAHYYEKPCWHERAAALLAEEFELGGEPFGGGYYKTALTEPRTETPIKAGRDLITQGEES